MKLSVIVPAHNEEYCIESTIRSLVDVLRVEKIPHEILVINDNSLDGTECILSRLCEEYDSVLYLNNAPPNGYGLAVRKGLENFTGDVVAIYMADASDTPKDLVQFYRVMLRDSVDCVFGNRFGGNARVVSYPKMKLVLNRLTNFFIRICFFTKYGDVTNGFKLYRRSTIEGLKPFLSFHFSLAVELPLKAIIRGYSYSVVPNDWINRKAGVSKLDLKGMSFRYLFIILYCFIEKWLSRGDYKKTQNIA